MFKNKLPQQIINRIAPEQMQFSIKYLIAVLISVNYHNVWRYVSVVVCKLCPNRVAFWPKSKEENSFGNSRHGKIVPNEFENQSNNQVDKNKSIFKNKN